MTDKVRAVQDHWNRVYLIQAGIITLLMMVVVIVAYLGWISPMAGMIAIVLIYIIGTLILRATRRQRWLEIGKASLGEDGKE